jgi:hypothetical protein
LMLCTKVSELADFLLANKAAPNPAATQQPQNNDWQVDLAVVEVPDETILHGHHYAREAGQIHNQVLGRMKALSLQLANLMTSLPPGIFVRHGSSRLDVMKILIVGPKDTPYENGLFEFDLLCPSTFPNSPPTMNLRTTGQGRIRFNPNLYNCGKGMSALDFSEVQMLTLMLYSMSFIAWDVARRDMATRQVHHPAGPRLHPGHDLLR